MDNKLNRFCVSHVRLQATQAKDKNAVHHDYFSFETRGALRNCQSGKCLHELFAARVQLFPESVAVSFAGESMTYQELDQRANQLAHWLRGLGAGPETLVGLALERGLDMVAGILGILKSGAAYVPLDPAYPTERMRVILEDARPLVVLTQKSLANRLVNTTAPVACLDDGSGKVWKDQPVTAPENRSEPDDLAYVIFTSGSTGRPKGVLITHYNVVRLMQATEPWFQFNERDVWTLFHSCAFDFSVWEIWGALFYGGRLVVVPYYISRSPGEFYKLLQREGVTVLNQTPSAFRQLMQAEAAGSEPGKLALRYVIFGGEALTPASLAPWFERHGDERPQLINMYGITETTVHVTYRPMRQADVTAPSLIGIPIPDLEIYILDEAGQPVATGEAGEIYVGGAGVGRGYLNRPELTAERFIPNPFNPGAAELLYRSGDLARRRPDGDLEYLGRKDNQVKIRGHRIELGEIETALAAHPDLNASAVVVQGQGDEKQLVAFVVARTGVSLSAGRLRQWLAEKIPVYMIPAKFVVLAALPLNPNGKVDRRVLADLDGTGLAVDTDYAAPSDERESVLCEIWETVLHRKPIGVRDNFFDLGGHSLLAASVCAQLSQRCQTEVPLPWIFEHPTIQLLARRMAGAMVAGNHEVALTPGDRNRPKPVSAGQRQMWLLRQSLPDPATYNQPLTCRLKGRLDRVKVKRALQRIQQRHEILRTALRQTGAELWQWVEAAETATLPWREVDLKTVPADQREGAGQAELLAEARRPFELAQAPLWRVVWLALAEDDQILAFTFHHSIINEWSLRLLVRELEAWHATDGNAEPAGLAPLAVHYADFAAWQNARLAGGRRAVLENYWRGQLSNLPPPLELPADRPRPLRPTGGGAVHEFKITEPTVAGFRQLARQEKTTLFTVGLAACQVWLHRYTGQTDIVAGTPAAQRERPEVQSLLGYFLNTLPVRTHLNGAQSFLEVAGQVRESLLGALSHADLPIDNIIELAGKPAGTGQAALFQVMFVLLEEGLPPIHLDGVVGQWVATGTRTSKNDLLLSIQADEHLWHCQLEYATDRFTPERAADMAGHFSELCRSMVAAPQMPINQLNLLTTEDRQQLLSRYRGGEATYSTNHCVHHLFEMQASATPDAVAVVFEEEVLTYHELNVRANRLAYHLRSRDVGPDTLVGLCVERSLEMCIGVLGILKAGAAYVPLDPTLPSQRLAYLISNAECAVIVTQNGLLGLIGSSSAPDFPAPLMVLLETACRPGKPEHNVNPEGTAGPDHLAYVLYTSGSTGRPKGVEMPHRPLVNLIQWQRTISAMGPGDRTLQFASLGFDVSFQEMFSTWATGGTLVVVPTDLRMQPAGLLTALNDWQIHRMFLPFVMLEQLAEADRSQATPPAFLKEVAVAGEQLRIGPGIRRFFGRLVGGRLWNHYGPAEAHVVTSYELPGAPSSWPDLPPIGRPLPHCEIYLLDAQLQPVTAGMIGELYIGGICLSRGYHRRTDLTSERFIPHPFAAEPGARLYRTGDLARWQTDGNLEFLGRSDHQVKLRGFRVELGEIETVLGEYADIAGCAVVPEERGADGGDKSLTAYLVGRHGITLEASAIRAWLKLKLPDYMIPARMIALAALPLNANGKVERSALKQLPGVELQTRNDWQAPANECERVLVDIWRTTLRREQVGVQDNFFDLGGHSLLAAVICSHITEQLRLVVPLRWLFEHPTIARLAKQMETLSPQAGNHEMTARADRHRRLPMSFSQQGMWLLNQTLSDPAAYNQPLACRLLGPVTPNACAAVSRWLCNVMKCCGPGWRWWVTNWCNWQARQTVYRCPGSNLI